MIIEVCSQNRALEEVTNIQTGELVSVISIASSDEKDVEFDCKENLCGVLHLKFNRDPLWAPSAEVKRFKWS